MTDRVLILGGTGLVGSHLARALAADGVPVTITTRDPTRRPPGPGIDVVAWDTRGPPPLGDATAVVNVAGASIGGKRWSAAYKDEIRDSRLRTSHAVVQAIAARPPEERPVFVSASAVGYYGRWPDGPCTEDHPPGDDFLADVCRDWEAAVAQTPGREVRLRFGHVLDADEGLLARLLPLYRARIAGPLGSGRQSLPWIHIDDLVAVLRRAITDTTLSGAYNAVAPGIVAYRDFNRTLATRLGVFARIPIPGFGLRIAAGGIAPYLTGGQDAVPRRLTEAGFTFRHPGLEGALADLLPAS